jgi:cytochrome P450
MTATSGISRIVTPAGDPAWHVTKFSLVKSLLMDARLGKTHPKPSMAPWYSRSGLAGGPHAGHDSEYGDHARRRGAMNRAFSRAHQMALSPWIEQTATELARDLAARTPPVDTGVFYFAPLTKAVVSRLLGVPMEVLDDFYAQSAKDSVSEMARRANFVRSMVSQADVHTMAPVSRLLPTSGRFEKTDAAWVTRLVSGMIVFGSETPATALDWTLHVLLSRPSDCQRIRLDKSLLPTAVEEALRLFHPPAATDDGLLRYAHHDLVVADQIVAAGEMVLLDVVAANRDPEVFERPYEFDLNREAVGHLSFGHGFYRCNFAQLARVEIEIGVRCLLTQIPRIRLGQLDGGGPVPSPDGRPASPPTVCW